jgi:hypothetical protein
MSGVVGADGLCVVGPVVVSLPLGCGLGWLSLLLWAGDL